jgi:ribonucleoside-diphosphate reductase alpha chain
MPATTWLTARPSLDQPLRREPLPPYGACLLGSINLARLVRQPFTPDARIDDDELAGLVVVAVRMMDNTIDVSRFPLEEQRREAFAKRRIGLGVTGLADALIMIGLRYGSPEAAAKAERWAEHISHTAYLTSGDLAVEKGVFPLFDREAYLAGETVGALPDDIRERIAAGGIRNALLTSIAPTGTISLFADNVSSGIEPVFALSYTRKVLLRDGSTFEEEVSDYALRRFREQFGPEALLPDHFITAQDLTPTEHVRMQAAVQRHVDSAISKTFNLPEDIPFEAFQDVYWDAYRSGCKGCTTYRPNPVTGAVLEATPAEAAPVPFATAQSPADLLVRSEKLTGATYKLRWPDSEHAFYVTIDDVETEGTRRPFEIFIKSNNLEHYAWVVALTRMISAVLRRGGDVSFVADELKQVFDPRGGQWTDRRYVPSLVAAIGEILERHMIDTGFLAIADPPVTQD